MKEHPILFKGEMVRAIVAGIKTQTRRLNLKTKYQVGDHLWVRETWAVGCRPDPFKGWVDGIEYRADIPLAEAAGDLPEGVDLDSYPEGWRPSLFMPRWASRFDLEIIAIRDEPLDDITEEDAQAEGAGQWFDTGPFTGMEAKSHRSGFRKIWGEINGGQSWLSNPIVRVITFKVVSE